MKLALKPVRSPFSPDSIERTLSRYYERLVDWSRVLSRGDLTAAEETVQDLCLHLTLSQPNLSRVNDLDNYLFICLRNMYVSNLERITRERLRVIHVEDYDAMGMAVTSGEWDSVDVQNELIRICDYVIARKHSSKSASHFILHFFLGYRRSDVARLARLPIAAIYNKLKDIRGELRKHLSSGEKMRVVPRGTPPESKLLRAALPSDLFLKELRSNILDADPASCIAEAELVDAYQRPGAFPVGCRELAHLAGCERCLGILERTLQFDHHDGPLDGINLDRTPRESVTKSFDATMRLAQQRRRQLLERRPTLLAIAVDGRVVAFHAIESAHNSLSSRVEAVSHLRFIEVFDEYGDRLAHVPLNLETAAFPKEPLSQHVVLSDHRWLRFDIRFDGFGVHAEVNYVDPALAQSCELEDRSHPFNLSATLWSRFQQAIRDQLTPWRTVGFASLLLAAIFGLLGYRYMHPGWRDVLARAGAAALVPSSTEVLHQTLRIEQASGQGKGAALGSIDVWRSSDRKMVRRFYNAQQQLLATSIDLEDGTSAVRLEKNATITQGDRQILESDVWQSDVSATAFSALQVPATEASRSLGGFEVTEPENGQGGVLSRTLALSRNYQVVAETIRFRTGEGISEVRLVQTLLRRVPNSDVPASIFPLSHEKTAPGTQSDRYLPVEPGSSAAQDDGANLEVAVLFELFRQNADVGQPIDVGPVTGGRVRLTGTLTDPHLLAAIREKVATLPNANLVDFHIYSAAQAASATHHGRVTSQELVGTAGDAPAAGRIRDALLARGLRGTALQAAEQEFATSALSHAQAALQHAFALERLGIILRRAGPSSLNPGARVKWAQMVQRHSAAAVTELEVLRLQLASVSTDVVVVPSVSSNAISDSDAFMHNASELRAKAQSVNQEVVELFAGSAVDMSAQQTSQAISRLRATLPVPEASGMRSFASRLTNQGISAQNQPGESRQR